MISRKLLSEIESFPRIDNSEYFVSNYGYGKDFIKILHIQRNGLVHKVNEFEVNTHIKLSTRDDWLKGMGTFPFIIIIASIFTLKRFFNYTYIYLS